jgi:soluble P-type ATPase
MIRVSMSNGKELRFEHAVFDYNGTLAVDGVLTDEIKVRLTDLSKRLHTVVITADTFGLAKSQLIDVPGVDLVILGADQGGLDKAKYIKRLGENVVVIGNGVNDHLMFQHATAICVIGREGASGSAIACADIIVTRPEDALDLLLNSKRMVATLRE